MKLYMSVLSGSSPHTRGALSVGSWCLCRSRIIPAYAGSTKTPAPGSRSSKDHPRIRGEHPATVHAERSASRIIPAYAGSTKTPAPGSRSSKDHPRIRGEHPATVHAERSASRIIPAYAGSTDVVPVVA